MKALTLSIIMLLALTTTAQLKPRAAFDWFAKPYDTKTVYPLPASSGMSEFEGIMHMGSFRVRTGADYSRGRFSVYFDQHVYMDKGRTITFIPLRAEWYTGLKVQLAKGVELKFEHLCIHPVGSDINRVTQIRTYGGYNMISIGYGY